jgi:hypothetical protein
LGRYQKRKTFALGVAGGLEGLDLLTGLEALVHFLVEVLQEFLAGLAHGVLDLHTQLLLQGVEGGLDLLGGAATLMRPDLKRHIRLMDTDIPW